MQAGNRAQSDERLERAWCVVATVPDPEIPVLTVVDLGIIRSIEPQGDHGLRVAVSPTYSGCPATAVIHASIEEALQEAGYSPVQVRSVLSPPWSSDWISEAGRDKLRAYGIAPPQRPVGSTRALLHPQAAIACPRCESVHTSRISEFGSTPCKALYRCEDCREPFEYFKCF
ncbi:MAG: 1,2-phenylacetyl-CoA epoxidase subunit PaaD [Steroidobacteraceae bacterium]